MRYEQYEKILKNGVKVDWYGSEVPEELITPLVKFAADGLSSEINKLESELNDSLGSSKEKKKAYINLLISNLQNLPYTLNGDAYLIKRDRIKQEILDSKPKTTKKRVTKTTKTVKTVKTTSKTTTKNSDLIFGKNKK